MYRSDVPGYVVLEDGTALLGFGFGAVGKAFGEMVFNTGMTGYQEMVTDPSYHGQIITFTYPMIGNHGVGRWLMESSGPRVGAVVVREAKNTNYDRTCPEAWIDWLSANGVVGVGGVDTRALAGRVRRLGAMTACVAAGHEFSVNKLLEETRGFPGLSGRDLVQDLTCPAPYEAQAEELFPDDSLPDLDGRRYHVVAFDYGIKYSILRRLLAVGCRVTVVPAGYTADAVLALKPQGILLSNGPGDPAPLTYAVHVIRNLVGVVPIFGIGLGHQLLSLAVGLGTFKLKAGHRGLNHPVKNYPRDSIEITSQNHGFAVEPPPVVAQVLARDGDLSAIPAEVLWMDSAYGPVRVTHLSLNDGTVEGLELPDVAVLSVQNQPEAGPGPHDGLYMFQRFIELMERGV